MNIKNKGVNFAVKKEPPHTFQVAGKWVAKPQKTAVLVCSSCGGKYIKTRDGQKVCLKCLGKQV